MHDRLGLIRCLSMLAMILAASAGSSQTPGNDGLATTDWPWWRGPDRDGVADSNQNPPMTWSEEKNIAWTSALPGRGHGSPIVVDDQVFLATADRQRGVQSVLCLARDDGTLLWETAVHRGGLMERMNVKASQASSTVACDGEQIFINFPNDGAVYTTALTRGGKIVWQEKVTDYVMHQGYGSSPAIYEDLVIVSADNKGGGAIVAFDRASGEERWRVERPAKPNYASPIILEVDGRDQLLMTGCDLVSAYDPRLGETLWEIEGATTECVTSTITDGGLIYTSGGYPRNHLAAVRADGSGQIVWQTNDRIYVPSMLVRQGYLYAVLDSGVASCWDAETGNQQWKARLGGNFTSSPVLVGDRIYAISEDAETTIFRATPEQFEELAVNQLEGDSFATPTITGGRIYARIGKGAGDDREEVLYCIGKP